MKLARDTRNGLIAIALVLAPFIMFANAAQPAVADTNTPAPGTISLERYYDPDYGVVCYADTAGKHISCVQVHGANK